MDTIATMPRGDRADLFRETAARMGLPPALIEKDFWVCWTLGQLFTIESLREVLLFKGGSSLSKVFNLINRFSEDIDLAVDYAPLGFTGDRDPAKEMPKARREKLLDEIMESCQVFIAGDFMRALKKRITHVLGNREPWSLEARAADPNTIEFRYPPAFDEGVAYVTPAVLLELGTHAELIPSGSYRIQPFAATEFPNVFTTPNLEVKAITAERTFWEKATILHVEHHRPKDKPTPLRYSRHYYDLAMMANSSVRTVALSDLPLLARVVAHKQKFYASAWAEYDLAVPPTLRLMPQEERVADLKKDYEAMKVMIFGTAPSFDEVLTSLDSLQREINGAA